METWKENLNNITEDSLSIFGNLSSEQLHWKPSPDTWSIAQNFEHLIVLNESYFPILRSLKEGTYKPPFMAKFGFIVSFLGKTVLNAVKPDRQKKIKTFSIWEPGESLENNDILRKFEHHQKELIQRIEDSGDLVNKGTVISSPANRNIVYRLETAFDIIVSHELRHLEQAKEVLELLRKTPDTNINHQFKK